MVYVYWRSRPLPPLALPCFSERLHQHCGKQPEHHKAVRSGEPAQKPPFHRKKDIAEPQCRKRDKREVNGCLKRYESTEKPKGDGPDPYRRHHDQ